MGAGETDFYDDPDGPFFDTEKAKAEAASNLSANTYSDAYLTGAYKGLGNNRFGQQGYDQSALRYDQTQQERVAEQINNYQYGGYVGGANDATAAARGAVDNSAYNLGLYGTLAYANSGLGNAMYGAGMGGLYGTAADLSNYAAQGPGASVAQANLQANTAQAMRQQLALAGSGRGQGGGASAFRQAAANQAQIQGQANAQAAMLQAQEAQDWRQAQLQAMGAAGGLYGQGAGLGSEYAQGMTELGMKGQEAAGNMALSGEQLAHQIENSAMLGRQGYEQNLTDVYGIDKGINKQFDPNEMTTKDWLGLSLDAASTAGEYIFSDDDSGKKTSDIRAKTNIQPMSALDAISDAGGYSYSYLDPARHGEGAQSGPMAHELRNVPGVVSKGPNGMEQIDAPRLTLNNTSAIAELNRKVDALAGTPSDFNPYAELPVRSPRRAAPRVDTSVAPKNQGVDAALKAFGSTPPSEREIVLAREALRGKYGSASANEFEQHAMALKREKGQPRPYTEADAAAFQQRQADVYTPEQSERDAFLDRYNQAIPSDPPEPGPTAALPRGPTQPIIGSAGRTIPSLTGNAGPLYGPPVANAPTQAEQDEIMREFYDPSERYRVYGL